MAYKFKISKDFASAKVDLPEKGEVLELSKDNNGDFDIFLHSGDNVEHLATLTYNEIKGLCQIVLNNEQ